jgi:hypothetical protein
MPLIVDEGQKGFHFRDVTGDVPPNPFGIVEAGLPIKAQGYLFLSAIAAVVLVAALLYRYRVAIARWLYETAVVVAAWVLRLGRTGRRAAIEFGEDVRQKARD